VIGFTVVLLFGVRRFVGLRGNLRGFDVRDSESPTDSQ